MGPPRPLPVPPVEGYSGPLAIVRVPKNQSWLRLFRKEHDPVHFGRTGQTRFNAPAGEFGLLYVARRVAGAFVETLVRDGRRELSEARLDGYRVAELEVSRGLKLVDLAGKGLVRMGLDARLNSGDYRVAQRWSSAFHDHPDAPDGILYTSRHDPTKGSPLCSNVPRRC